MYGWLIAHPIAHRGLHERAAGRIENSLSAARAACARGYAIECDVQLSADGEAMVFHDVTLDRLTGEHGPLAARTAQALGALTLTGSSDIIPTLTQLLAKVAAAVPVICEIKSAFDGDMALARRVADIAATYDGALGLKSFDPAVLAFLRREQAIAHLPLGLVAEAAYAGGYWEGVSAPQRRAMESLTHWSQTRPDFLSWRVDDLPHATPSLCRAHGLPVLAWTVRTPAQRQRAREFADQMIFEGFEV